RSASRAPPELVLPTESQLLVHQFLDAGHVPAELAEAEAPARSTLMARSSSAPVRTAVRTPTRSAGRAQRAWSAWTRTRFRATGGREPMASAATDPWRSVTVATARAPSLRRAGSGQTWRNRSQVCSDPLAGL